MLRATAAAFASTSVTTHSFAWSFITLRLVELEHRHTRRNLCLENTVAEKFVTNVGIDKMNVSRD
jgi:hypothetical protein